ncbi:MULTISPECIES: thioesterase family protein [Microbacterium]|uniref:acyl-CoA thioesterase n=1 Tax=Microbacterium TaxID=33882 RepID=UPI00278B9BC7|nr:MULTISPECIES: thioesterase family protein [Microbacterium]MDQ1084053.1 acyl-CoA thioester hydrolase [Microbacterium sp. SORGH_AS_0344]MDQ1170668.1 acyl-CoA thioester hydrolase [Microbacterium proteolyticum]
MTETPATPDSGPASAGPERVHVPIQLRWGDLDALGHVNNTSMLKLLEEARLRAFWRSDDGGEALPTAVFDMSVLESGGARATLIARQEIEYLRPVPYSQRPLDVRLWIGAMGGSSADICFEVFSPAGDADPVLYARATVVVVLVDTASGRPIRWSAAERDAWAPVTGDPIDYRRRTTRA